MRPAVWRPPAEPSAAELAVIKAVRRARLFVFLREHRHELFSEEFQAELAQAYADKPKGQPPVPPAQLALATILQAYAGVSDDEVIEATVMDRRWQLALDCLDADGPPFSKGTLVGFRKRLIRHNLDRRLVDRTVELATATGGFGARALRAALDSSPLWGAGRVEDTINLMGHALRKALGVIAVLQGRGQAEGIAGLAEQAGAPMLAASSLKAALDRDWDDPAARDAALAEVLRCLDAVEAFAVRDRDSDLAIFCKAWRVRNTTGRYAKTEFALDFAAGQLTCPAGVAMPFQPGKTVRFPKATCAACPLQGRCTTSSNGRSVSIHPGEALLAELRQRQQSPAGRAKLRERVQVEHTLAHVGHWQGRRARYRGTRKNLFDLRRVAVVHNLHVIARQPAADNDQLAA